MLAFALDILGVVVGAFVFVFIMTRILQFGLKIVFNDKLSAYLSHAVVCLYVLLFRMDVMGIYVVTYLVYSAILLYFDINRTKKVCPHCKRSVNQEAGRCSQCGKSVDEPSAASAS